MGQYSGSKILITGRLGFIGSNLARALVAQGAKVTLVDSLIPLYGGNIFNIDDIRDSQGLKVSERHAATCLSLPCHPQMSHQDVASVIAAVNKFRGA
jgi:nucleoside-diphosphate-sugar epimerase